LLLASCKKEEENQKLFMIQLIKERISKVDSTQVHFDFIQMEGTDYLIHPVGDLRVLVSKDKACVIDLLTISN
jgi:hypothetical protein